MEFISVFIIVWFSIVIVALTVVPVMLLRAWVIVSIWGWYIAPFFAVPAMTIPIDIGISCLISILWYNQCGSMADQVANASGNLDQKQKWGVYLAPFINLFVMWLVAFIASHWLPEPKVASLEPVVMDTVAIEVAKD
jgi:hypothetical protein